MGAGGDSGLEPATAGDRFYRGTIEKLFPGNEKGVIRSVSGREFSFSFRHVVLLGEVERCEDLAEGMAVGFDLSQTSSGLVVAVIHAGR